MTQAPGLLPCPFCGGESKQFEERVYCGGLSHRSGGCGASMAVSQWNTRAPATLEEGLRDYAMFGKFVAMLVAERKQETWIFAELWNRGQVSANPEFVAFVKEEMGK